MWDINFIHFNHNVLTTVLLNQLFSKLKVAFLGIKRNNVVAMAAYRYRYHIDIGRMI